MAVEIEAPGQLQEFLEVLRKRKWQVILPAAFVLTIGSAFAVIVPKKYEVDTGVELRTASIEGFDERTSPLASQAREAQNAALHIRSTNRVRRVLENLKWTDFLSLPESERFDYVRDVVDDIDVTIPRTPAEGGSTFVTIEYQNVDPQRAAEFLEALRTDWIENEVERGRRAIESQEKALLDRKVALERDRREQQDRLTQLQSEYAISPTQPTPGGASRNEDPMFEAFQERSKRLEELESERLEVEATLKALRERIAEVEPRVLSTERSGAVDFAEQIAKLELQIAEYERERSSYKSLHSAYRKLTDKIQDLKDQIDDLREQQTGGSVVEDWIDNPEYLDLKRRIDDGDVRLAALVERVRNLNDDLGLDRELLRERNDVYGTIRAAESELARIEEALAENRLSIERNKNLLDIVSGPAGNPFQITNPVTVPSDPSEPNPWLIAAFSLVAGIGVGLAVAVLAEYSKSCFRSAADISRVMVVPVLGVVNTIRTRGKERRDRIRRAVVGGSSALLIGAITFVTWAWASNQALLSPWLLEQIEEFRKLFV